MRRRRGFVAKRKGSRRLGLGAFGSLWRRAAALRKKNWRGLLSRAFGQYVVLGAGLDTFAYRNPFADLRVFEVDHPDTQAWKRERLRHGGIAVPESMRFAPVDFERDTLAHGLEAVGFRGEEPAFFSWLGVVPYLTREAAFATLRFIAGMPRGSGVVFDYSIPREMMTENERRAFDALAERGGTSG
jgi:methyltransferase (TIGR00027 family)